MLECFVKCKKKIEKKVHDDEEINLAPTKIKVLIKKKNINVLMYYTI